LQNLTVQIKDDVNTWQHDEEGRKFQYFFFIGEILSKREIED
jgi:hypothetical protein